MESEARRTGRAHEHELCPESARSAWQHRPAEHSRRAVSTCSRADYEKSDKQCHDAFVLQNLLAELVSPIVRQALRLPCGNRSGCPTNEKIGALTQPPLLRAVFSACRESLDLANTAVRMLAKHHEFGFLSRDCSLLNATLHRSVLLRAPPQQHCKNRLSTKKSLQLKANQSRTGSDSPRQLASSAADSFNNLANCIDHELRLLLVYLMAAICFGHMLFVRQKLCEPLLCFFCAASTT